MRIKKFAYIAALLGAVSLLAEAETNPETAFAGFGTWSAECDAWGVAATCTSAWRRGLAADHVIQDYAIVSRADATPIFSGRGLYRVTGTQVSGIWEDSRGAILELSGRYDAQRLEITWVDPQTEIGRSIYHWDAGQLDVTDAVLTDEGWRVFMSVSYPAP